MESISPQLKLDKVEFATPILNKPEDVEFDEDGNLYTGLEDGSVVKIDVKTQKVDTILRTSGRVLGLRFDPHHNLVMCDGNGGLLSFNFKDQTLSVLSTFAGGERIRFANHLDINKNGVVYFTGRISLFIYFPRHGKKSQLLVKE